MGIMIRPGANVSAPTPHNPPLHTGPTGHFSGHANVNKAAQEPPPPGALPNEVADDKPAMLSEGELVLPADEVRWHGLEKLMKMKDQAKKGLMQMAAQGQIQSTDSQQAHPAAAPGQMAMADGGFTAENAAALPASVKRSIMMRPQWREGEIIPRSRDYGEPPTDPASTADVNEAVSKIGLARAVHHAPYQSYDDTTGDTAARFSRGGYMGPHVEGQDMIYAAEGGYVDPNGGVDEEVPMFAGGGLMGTNVPAPAPAPTDPSASVYNAYLQTGGKTAPAVTPFLDASGNFNFGFANPSGEGVNASSGAVGGAGPVAMPAAPQGLMAMPQADQPGTSGNGMIASQTAPTSGTNEVASSTGPAVGTGLMASPSNDATPLLPATAGGAASGLMTPSGVPATGQATPQAPGGDSTLSLAKDAASVIKTGIQQISDPNSFLNTTWDNIFGTSSSTSSLTDAAANGFGDVATNLGGEAVAANNAIGSAGQFGAETAAAGDTAAAAGADVAGNIGTGLISAGAGLVGGMLGSLITGGQHPVQAGIGGAIGGVVGGVAGGALLGAELGSAAGPIGAAAGALLGTVVGSLFGPHPSVGPNGGITIKFDPKTNTFQNGPYGTDNQGSANPLFQMSGAYNNTMNSLLQQIGGKIKNAPPVWAFGYFKGNIHAQPADRTTPTSYAEASTQFADGGTAVLAAVKDTVARTAIQGGDPYVLTAIRNSQAKNINDLMGDVSFAKSYQSFVQNSTGANAVDLSSVQEFDPNSPILQLQKGIGGTGDMTTRAKQLGLVNIKTA